MRAALFLLILTFMNVNVHASLSCVALLQGESSFTYMDRGATNLVFEKDGLVYKVPFSPEASDYGSLDGYETAAHEAHLLSRFHDILEHSGISEFRPLKFVSAQKLESQELIDLAKKEMRRLGVMFNNSTEINGVFVAEKVYGRTLYDIVKDPEVSVQVKIRLVNKFNDTLLKLEEYLQGPQKEFELVGKLNKVTYDELNNLYIDRRILQIYGLIINIKPTPEAKGQDTNLGLASSMNVIVEEDGTFVLVDPN